MIGKVTRDTLHYTQPDRRAAIGILGGVIAGGLVVTACQKQAALPELDQEKFIAAIADHVIPDSDTPGAVAAGVPAFVVRAVAAGTLGIGRNAILMLADDLLAAAGRGFTALARAEQAKLLTQIDRRAYADSTPSGAWPPIKTLIVQGYYRSKPGASQELVYALVPGPFRADVPCRPGDRAMFNDWLAIRFS